MAKNQTGVWNFKCQELPSIKGPENPQSALIMSEPFSAIMMVGALVFPMRANEVKSKDYREGELTMMIITSCQKCDLKGVPETIVGMMDASITRSPGIP